MARLSFWCSRINLGHCQNVACSSDVLQPFELVANIESLIPCPVFAPSENLESLNFAHSYPASSSRAIGHGTRIRFPLNNSWRRVYAPSLLRRRLCDHMCIVLRPVSYVGSLQESPPYNSQARDLGCTCRLNLCWVLHAYRKRSAAVMIVGAR